jgi:hypothetical protein
MKWRQVDVMLHFFTTNLLIIDWGIKNYNYQNMEKEQFVFYET